MSDPTAVLRVTVGGGDPEAGADRRGEAVLDAARAADNEATDDGLAVRKVGPTGATRLEPLVLATRGGRTAFHSQADTETAATVATSLAAGDLPTDDALAVVDHGPEPAERPRPTDGPLGAGTPRVLAGAGWRSPTAAPDDPLTAREPGRVEDAGADLGLRGRGRGDAAATDPVAPVWRTCRETSESTDRGEPVVVVNGAESDPAVVGDRLLLETAAGAILDSALAVARAVGATDVVVAVPERDGLAAERARAAADRADPPDPAPAVSVAAVPTAYTSAEPTMVLEALEGNDRIEARRRPPGPAEWGLYGRPTVVHTPRTLAAVGAAVRTPSAFDPDAADPGTRLVTVRAGDDLAGTVELSTGAPLRRAVESLTDDGAAGTAAWSVVGGRFGGLTRDLSVPVAAPALGGADLGTNGAVETFAGDDCPLAAVGRRARFARNGNCGRCVPCREGSKQLHELLQSVYDGAAVESEARELLRTMAGTSLCAFGRDATRPTQTLLDRFDGVVRAHADGRCPAGECPTGSATDEAGDPAEVWT